MNNRLSHYYIKYKNQKHLKEDGHNLDTCIIDPRTQACIQIHTKQCYVIDKLEHELEYPTKSIIQKMHEKEGVLKIQKQRSGKNST